MSENPLPRDNLEPPKNPTLLAKAGLAATAIWVLALTSYIFAIWPNFVAMTPDQFAGFLSGAFAPLALGWVVLGFFQQGHELRQNAHALKLQGDELRHSVEQQRELVQVTREQLQAELDRVVHERAELARTSNPQLRLQKAGHMTTSGTMLMDFYLVNVGVACTEVKASIEPSGIKLDEAALSTGQRISIRIGGEIGKFVPQTVTITYLNARQIPGSAVFEIPVENVAGYGSTLGTPAVIPD
jgi:hypothetical protein